MSQEELDELVARGVIEQVAADPETARIELEQARLHVGSATEIAERDPVAAFAIGYDALLLESGDVVDVLARAAAIIVAIDADL